MLQIQIIEITLIIPNRNNDYAVKDKKPQESWPCPDVLNHFSRGIYCILLYKAIGKTNNSIIIITENVKLPSSSSCYLMYQRRGRVKRDEIRYSHCLCDQSCLLCRCQYKQQ
ncbi:hypothetical protein T03_13620 [Trichinella britovi]|uniref:Uncharacterized protein n=1 Tax=Trichinella britovi TaxID=45882 RepID=A0A0V1CWU3_TRIBR|nr:hypothetical protein T03_13620 [Trichinella britovi]